MIHVMAASAAPLSIPEPLELGAVSVTSGLLALMVRIKVTIEIHVPATRRRRGKKK